jgi:hypothetical protein
VQPIGQPHLKTHRAAMALSFYAFNVFVHVRPPDIGSFNVRIPGRNARNKKAPEGAFFVTAIR